MMKYNGRKLGRGALALLLCALMLLAGCAQPTPQVVVPGQQGSVPQQTASPTPRPWGDYVAPAQPDNSAAMPQTAPAQEDPGAAGETEGIMDAMPETGMEGEDPLLYTVEVEPVVGDINIGMVLEDEAALHPLDCEYRDLISMNELVFESVMTLDDSMQPVGELADSWTGAGTNYSFHLRSGVLFHNGEPLTAQDVVESWQ